jgi:hypothetical protein
MVSFLLESEILRLFSCHRQTSMHEQGMRAHNMGRMNGLSCSRDGNAK